MEDLPGTPPDVALPAGTRLGRLVRVDRTAYDVQTTEGRVRLPADPRLDATVGDWLAVTETDVVALLPRTSLLSRGAASGTSRPQPLAANVDVVLVCSSLGATLPLRRIERLLTLAWDSGATPVLVLTKADLARDPAAAVRDVQPHAPSVEIVTVSAATGDVAQLAGYTGPGRTLVLLGTSGCGKSTLVNALAGREVMATSDARHVDGKGRHTTTHRELVVLPDGTVVIDTPGLRGVAVTGSSEALDKAFVDVEQLALACRFADCAHAGEPGCAVQSSIDAGDLSAARMDSWRHLQRELAFQTRRTDLRLRAAERAKWKTRAREQRQRYRP